MFLQVEYFREEPTHIQAVEETLCFPDKQTTSCTILSSTLKQHTIQKITLLQHSVVFSKVTFNFLPLLLVSSWNG